MIRARNWMDTALRVMSFEAAGWTDVGLRRESNEDSLLLRPDIGLFVIADGMGGHAAGEVASSIAVEAISAFFSNPEVTWPGDVTGSELDPLALLAASVKHANTLIHAASIAEPSRRGMGTTVVAALASGDRLSVVHVGDSRASLFRSGHLVHLTTDHTVSNELLQEGMPRDLAMSLPVGKLLTRALGTHPSVEVGVRSEVMRLGDILLLTSDGVHDQVEDGELVSMLGDVDGLAAGVDGMIRRANEKGGKDNSTAILVRWSL